MIKKIIKNHPVISIIVSNMLVDTCCTGFVFCAFFILLFYVIGRFLHLPDNFVDSFTSVSFFIVYGSLKVFLLPYVYTIIKNEVESGFAVDFIESLKNNILFLPFLCIICCYLASSMRANIAYQVSQISQQIGFLVGTVLPSYIILYLYWSYLNYREKKSFPTKFYIFEKWYYSFMFLLIICFIYVFFVKNIILK